jgi:hypothetical protein
MRATSGTGGATFLETRSGVALVALAVWAMAVPWIARALNLEVDVPTRLEVIDHVVPGVVVLVCAAILARRSRRDPAGGLQRLVACAVASLAGGWIAATHLTLVPEALDGVTGWGPALLHLSAGPPIVIFALWVLVTEP